MNSLNEKRGLLIKEFDNEMLWDKTPYSDTLFIKWLSTKLIMSREYIRELKDKIMQLKDSIELYKKVNTHFEDL